MGCLSVAEEAAKGGGWGREGGREERRGEERRGEERGERRGVCADMYIRRIGRGTRPPTSLASLLLPPPASPPLPSSRWTKVRLLLVPRRPRCPHLPCHGMRTEAFEETLCVKNECFVYPIPPAQSTKGYKASDWDIAKPLWSGRLRMTAKGDTASIHLEDRNGDPFAVCRVAVDPGQEGETVEPVRLCCILRHRPLTTLGFMCVCTCVGLRMHPAFLPPCFSRAVYGWRRRYWIRRATTC